MRYFHSSKARLLLVFLFLLLIAPLTILSFRSQKVQTTQSHALSPFIGANGTQLTLYGQPYTFSGINAYQIATQWGINHGCGGQYSDAELDQLFSSLRPNSMVRFWVFQSQAINKTTKQLDFSPIDRVITSAQKYNQRLILTIGDQWADCDGYQKDESWYGGGYRMVNNVGGINPLSYWDYLHQIVPRYASFTTIGMWELINEPETQKAGGECLPTAAQTLRQFFDTVGGEVKRLDPNHLVSSGTIGSGQCGAQQEQYKYVHESPGIDVASYHDYGADTVAIPGDQWNGLQVRMNQMRQVNKPLFVGEAGIKANDTVGCTSIAVRRDQIKAKLDAQFTGGVVGFLMWNYSANSTCNYDLSPNDPSLVLLKTYPLPFAPTAPVLKMGDINQDNVVSILDYTVLFENYGKKPMGDPRCDINTDGVVNILDYAMLFEHFGN